MKKILVIDDSMSYAKCIQVFLRHHGYQTEAAASLEEARAMIGEEIPLLICADLALPDGLALELLDEIRILNPQLPFLLMSCHEKDDWEKEAMRRGATLCMDKMKTKYVRDRLLEYAYRQYWK